MPRTGIKGQGRIASVSESSNSTVSIDSDTAMASETSINQTYQTFSEKVARQDNDK